MLWPGRKAADLGLGLGSVNGRELFSPLARGVRYLRRIAWKLKLQLVL